MASGSRPRLGPGAYSSVSGAHLFLGQWEEKENFSAAAESQCLYLNFARTSKLVVFMA